MSDLIELYKSHKETFSTLACLWCGQGTPSFQHALLLMLSIALHIPLYLCFSILEEAIRITSVAHPSQIACPIKLYSFYKKKIHSNHPWNHNKFTCLFLSLIMILISFNATKSRIASKFIISNATYVMFFPTWANIIGFLFKLHRNYPTDIAS